MRFNTPKHLVFHLFVVLQVIGFNILAQTPLDIYTTTTPSNADLYAYFPFNGNLNNLGSGGQTALNSGAIYTVGMCGQALNFDGIDDYVTVTPNHVFNSDYTITAWIKTNDTSSIMGIFSIREQCPNNYMGLSVVEWAFNNYAVTGLSNDLNKHQNCTGWSAGDRYQISPFSYGSNEYIFIALRVENNNTENRLVKMYVNCAEYSITQTMDFPSVPNFSNTINYITTIGATSSVPNQTNTFNGSIDELRVYDEALSGEEIQEIYRNCRPLELVVNNYQSCSEDSANIELQYSEPDVNYQLVDLTNNLNIGGPIAGSCGSIYFNTPNVSSPTQYVIEATHLISGNTIVLDTVISLSPGGSGIGFTDTLVYNLCEGDTLYLSNQVIYNSGLFTDTISVPNSCDSLLIYDVSILTSNLDLGEDTTLCEGNTLTLTPGGDFDQYLWQDGSIASSYAVNQPGVYTVTSTNQCGTFIDSIGISYINIPLDLGADTVICEGDTLVLDVFVNGADYVWQDASTSSIINVDSEGEYFVTISIGDCFNTDTLNINIINNNSFNLPESIEACEEEELLLSVPVNLDNLTWSTGESTSSIVIPESAVYWVVSNGGCGLFGDTVEVNLLDCDCDLFIPNTFTPDGNEFNNTFKVEQVCNFTSFNLKVFNRWGEIVWESSDPKVAWDGVYKGTVVANGTYVYRLEYDLPEREAVQIYGHINVLR